MAQELCDSNCREGEPGQSVRVIPTAGKVNQDNQLSDSNRREDEPGQSVE